MGMFLLLLVILVGLYVYANTNPAQATRACMRAARYLCGFRAVTVMVDGFEWHFIDSLNPHDAPKPIVLLIHGFGADKDSWLGYGRLLTADYRVIALDLPPFGDSEQVSGHDYTPRVQAARVAAFCHGLGLTQLHVAGSSMGGYIASWLAVDHPQLLSSMTLMNPAGVFGRQASIVQTQAEAGTNVLKMRNDTEFRQVMNMLAPKPPFVPRFVRRYAIERNLLREQIQDEVFWQMAHAQQEDKLQLALASVVVPTLVVWGDQDAVIDVSCAEVFADSISDSELMILPGKGHIPMFEAPVATARRHRELMQRVS
ncbi:MAG: alpha/beta hydrolase [Pseudomonadota bacterium]